MLFWLRAPLGSKFEYPSARAPMSLGDVAASIAYVKNRKKTVRGHLLPCHDYKNLHQNSLVSLPPLLVSARNIKNDRFTAYVLGKTSSLNRTKTSPMALVNFVN
jgi:hypothetical protein